MLISNMNIQFLIANKNIGVTLKSNIDQLTGVIKGSIFLRFMKSRLMFFFVE